MCPFDSNYQHILKLLIIGDSGVGKSSLLLRYADNKFPRQHLITIGVDFKIRTVTINGERVKLQIWDTAGQERFRLITSSYYRGAHGVVVMYDVTCQRSFNRVNHWLQEVESNCGKICRLLVGNKNDNPQLKKVPSRDAKRFADQHGMAFIETSAKECFNVENVFTKIASVILEQKANDQRRPWICVEDDSIILSDPRIAELRNQGMCC